MHSASRKDNFTCFFQDFNDACLDNRLNYKSLVVTKALFSGFTAGAQNYEKMMSCSAAVLD